MDRGPRRELRDRTHDTCHRRRLGRCLGRDGVEGHQRPHGRRPLHPGADPGPAAPARVRRTAPATHRAPHDRGLLPGHPGHLLHRDPQRRAGRGRGPRRLRGRLGPSSRGPQIGALGLGPGPGQRRPQSGRRCDQRAFGSGPEGPVPSPGSARGHRCAEHAPRSGDQRRLDQLRRWRRGHGTPRLSRTSPDRLPRRPALGGLQPGPDARLPGHSARGRDTGDRGLRALRTSGLRRGLRGRLGTARPPATPRRRSSRSATRWRWASSRRPGCEVCASPRT